MNRHLFRSLNLAFVAAVSGVLAAACGAPSPARSVSAEDCAAVSSDAELAVLYTRPVQKVEPIRRYRASIDHHDLEGVAIKVAPTTVPEKELERALTCHAARHNIAAISSIQKPSDPLHPSKGMAAVRVERSGSDLIVKVTSTDEEVARDILQRALLLERQGS